MIKFQSREERKRKILSECHFFYRFLKCVRQPCDTGTGTGKERGEGEREATGRKGRDRIERGDITEPNLTHESAIWCGIAYWAGA